MPSWSHSLLFLGLCSPSLKTKVHGDREWSLLRELRRLWCLFYLAIPAPLSPRTRWSGGWGFGANGPYQGGRRSSAPRPTSPLPVAISGDMGPPADTALQVSSESLLKHSVMWEENKLSSQGTFLGAGAERLQGLKLGRLELLSSSSGEEHGDSLYDVKEWGMRGRNPGGASLTSLDRSYNSHLFSKSTVSWVICPCDSTEFPTALGASHPHLFPHYTYCRWGCWGTKRERTCPKSYGECWSGLEHKQAVHWTTVISTPTEDLQNTNVVLPMYQTLF